MKILLVDDERLIREGMKIILSTYEDVEIMGEAANGYEAFSLCSKTQIDIILMDIRMPECDGVKGTKLIKSHYPDIKILILTTFSDMEYIQDAIGYGASGYLLKDSDYDLIYQSLKAACQGNVVIHPDVAQKLLHQPESLPSPEKIMENFGLTKQEITVIQQVADGKSNKDIADALFLSEGTVKNHISNILSKLDLKNRTQLTIFAYKEKIK